MKNEILKREIENNWESHEIFEFQNYNDLEELKLLLNKSDKDIVIELNNENLHQYENVIYTNNNKKEVWEHVISKIIIGQIRNKYRNMEVPNEPISRITTLDYIKLINPKDVRLHIILNCNNIYLRNEILKYIDNNIPFITMIYSNNGINKGIKINDNNYIWDLYNYKLFNGYNENMILSRKK